MKRIESPGGRAGHSLNEAQRAEKKLRKEKQRRHRRVDSLFGDQVSEQLTVAPPRNEKIIVDLLPAGPKVTIISLGKSEK